MVKTTLLSLVNLANQNSWMREAEKKTLITILHKNGFLESSFDILFSEVS
jgi:hypothetical protein